MHDDRSPERYAGVTGAGRRLAFALSLWVSLATAVICAVMPAGLPATRTIGSAFDPSTTIVALRSRPPVAKPAVLRAADDGEGIGDHLLDRVILLPVAPAPPILAGIGPASITALSFSVPAPRALAIALYARPPPSL